MTSFMKSFRKLEMKFDRNAEWFASHHPCFAFIAMFIGLPAFILLSVALVTTIITIPLGWMLGWF